MNRDREYRESVRTFRGIGYGLVFAAIFYGLLVAAGIAAAKGLG